MTTCGKYVGDNDGTCPQLTCIREAQHQGPCDNVHASFALRDSETPLPDDANVYLFYVYIKDGVFWRNEEIDGGTVADLKRATGAKEIRRCDLFGHPGARLGDHVELPNTAPREPNAIASPPRQSVDEKEAIMRRWEEERRR